MISRNSLYGRFVSLLLIAVTFWATLLPATLVIAEGEEAPPAPQEAVVEPVPAAEVAIEPTSEPDVVVTETVTETPPTETTTAPEASNAGEVPGEDGADAPDGAPSATPPAEAGENGADQTPTTPAENGGNGENGATGGTDQWLEGQDGEESIIETGNATAGATGETSANTTDATVPAGSTDASSAEATVDVENDLAMLAGAGSDAETGENEAVDPDGVKIKTGDSEAFAYLISLFNIAITNSHGSILFLRNPMGDALNLTDRIMAVFMNLFGGNGECSFVSCKLSDAILNFFADSTAEITNSVVVRSGTGENTGTSQDGDVLIETGKATAFGSIVNFGNLQIIDSRYLVILMTNVGDLAGDIVLPEPEFFKSLSSGAAIARGSDATFINEADITNHGTSTADTGSNTTLGEDGTEIGTGKARATTAEMNFVNQLGAPICFVVATGGEWNGTIHGLPDGFSREKAPFGELICGRGGAEREAFTQLNGTTTNYAKILNEAIVEAVSGKNIAEGVQAKIKAGDADAFTQILNVVNQQIIGQDWIFALFTISGDWDGDMVFGSAPTDTNPTNAVAAQLLATAAVNASSAGAYGGNSGGYTSKAQLEITKAASVNETTTPATVDYTVVVKNVGEGAVYRAKLSDMLTGEDGEIVYARTWNLNTIAHGEKIELTYSVEYNEGIAPGVYTNTARVVGNLNSSIYVYPIQVNPTEASAQVTILGDAPAEEVVALAPAEQCVPIITSYIRAGAATNNPTDVKNLQKFLKDVESEQVDENGIYDIITIAAVKRFQMKYSSEILTPWGITEPTGHVYYTTQNKINNLACTGNESFNLSDDQRREVDRFRARVSQIPPQADPISEGIGAAQPELEEVLSQGPSPVGAQVLLKTLTPTQPAAAAASEPVSSAFNPLKAISWLTAFVPFVEALEL